MRISNLYDMAYNSPFDNRQAQASLWLIDKQKDLNVTFPRRLITGATTLNRDLNGAKNIALIGFSYLAPQDYLPLPPCRRTYNSNK